MIKAIFLGFCGIIISVILITIIGVVLPFSNYREFSLSTLLYVGFFGPLIEEFMRTLFVKWVNRTAMVFGVVFGLSWGLTESFMHTLQATNFFSSSISDYYNLQITVSLIGTLLMHVVCTIIIISGYKNPVKAFGYALMLHSVHNLSAIVLSNFLGFSYLEKLLKILVYIILLRYPFFAWRFSPP